MTQTKIRRITTSGVKIFCRKSSTKGSNPMVGMTIYFITIGSPKSINSIPCSRAVGGETGPIRWCQTRRPNQSPYPDLRRHRTDQDAGQVLQPSCQTLSRTLCRSGGLVRLEWGCPASCLTSQGVDEIYRGKTAAKLAAQGIYTAYDFVLADTATLRRLYGGLHPELQGAKSVGEYLSKRLPL